MILLQPHAIVATRAQLREQLEPSQTEAFAVEQTKPGPYFLRDAAQEASREWISPD